MSTESRTSGLCTCRVTGPNYEQTRFDPACPYHGKDGTMIAAVPRSEFKRIMHKAYAHVERKL